MPKPRQLSGPNRRAITPLLRDAAPLLMLGSALFYTNRWLTLTGGETSSLSAAAHNLHEIFSSAGSAEANAHPSVYELLLHIWLRITGGAFDSLRAPAIIFFLAGLWLLSRVARRLGGEESGNALVWLGALWPYGFHAGRLAEPYTFAFLLIAAVTWQYFRCIAIRQWSNWVLFCLLSLLLLYTNDFAWALLILLAVEYWLHSPQTNDLESGVDESKEKTQATLGTAALLALGFAPRWGSLVSELHSHVFWPHSVRFFFLNAAYNFYLLFVSQSVAPWFWHFSIAAEVGIVLLLAFVAAGTRGEARRFLIFSLLLFALMAVAGILQTERLLLVGPWLLLPLAIALGTIEKPQWRIPMAVAVASIAAVGWYGTLNRRYYSEAQLFEPWSTVAQDASAALRNGSGVISDDNSFFFYLTYELKPAASNSRWSFTGVLPRQVQYPSVWDPGQWQQSGRPKTATVLWIRGSSQPNESRAMNEAGEWLNNECGDRITRYLARDPAYSWKQRFVPNFSGPAWLIEIRQYFCGPDANAPTSKGGTENKPH